MRFRIYSLLPVLLLVYSGCASAASDRPHLAEVSSSSGAPTELVLDFITEPDLFWRERLGASARSAEQILSSIEFIEECRASRMSRRNGKPTDQVCTEFSQAGHVTIKLDFYHDPRTRAIGYESDGIVYINTAKPSAGGPGNLVHELAHVLGYTHFTNWRFLAGGSVPYVLGDLVDSLAERRDDA